ncbi:MAG: sigma-54 dependent transcriptional regulator [Woeseiaceae bacterium]|nr:sigma-54 dependent transcriptional regulator [Woeseiaceae bacterium]
MNPLVLVIDDNEGVRTALSVLFSVHDLPCITAATVEDGLEMLESHPVGLVVQDMNFSEDTTSGKEGVALFHTIRERHPDLPVILLTAWTHLETAVELVRAGAADYLAKPWDDNKLIATARNLLELGEATERGRQAARSRRADRARLETAHDLCGTVFESTAMQELIGVATRVAPADVPILITGPNGAGKEKFADIIHANSSVADGPYIKVNVGALPADLMEAELFGAEAGAYTGASKARVGRFEAADGGTLFLDEIGNLSLDGQAKLLRVLQTGEYQRLGSSKTNRVTVRVVSATNADLPAEVEAGRFREDLYYRLNVIEIAVPPLRDRPDDILPLAYHFLENGVALDADAEAALLAHPWSGNVRELENSIRRASLLASDKSISAGDLGLPVQRPATVNGTGEPDEQAIRTALDDAHGVVARAARDLGLSRQALYRRMEKFGIHK